MKHNYAARIIALLFFCLIACYAFAQGKPNTFKITNKGKVSDTKPYEDALNAANMDSHRLRDKRAVITFDTGVTVELFSANELAALGYSVNPEDFETEKDPAAQRPVFALAGNNYILQLHTPTGKQ
jgi:YbbR domain-containing protein